MAPTRIRTGIIGTGFMGRVHLEAVRRLGFVDVVAVAGTNADKARALADGFGVAETTADYRTLLTKTDLDAVHICTPNAHHYAMACAALDAGKHVLCEKPLAMTSGEARISCLAREHGDCAMRRATTFVTTRWCSTCGACVKAVSWARS